MNRVFRYPCLFFFSPSLVAPTKTRRNGFTSLPEIKKTPTTCEASAVSFILIFTKKPSKSILAHTFSYICSAQRVMTPQEEGEHTHTVWVALIFLFSTCKCSVLYILPFTSKGNHSIVNIKYSSCGANSICIHVKRTKKTKGD